jgi:D-threo-aldose 1-dehydrogenase
MKTRTNRRGLALTELGLGAAQLGNLYSELTDDEAAATVDQAWADGIRYFDTAPFYGLGLSERRLGAALAKYPRDEVVVSSKVGRILVPTPETAHLRADGIFVVPADARCEWDFTRDGILRSLENSLERTGLDRFDVLYLHDAENHWGEASTTGIDTLIELREEGVVRAVGAGMNDTEHLADLVRRADVDQVMLAGRFTLLEQGALDELIPLAIERDVRVVVAGAFNSGLLSQPRPAADATYNYEQAPSAVVAKVMRIVDVCDRHGVDLPTAALAFPLLNSAVVSVVVGAHGATQARENVERYEREVPTELWAELAELGLISL